MFTLKPHLVRIEINEDYCDGIISNTSTCRPYDYWFGYKIYRWLWFTFKKRYNNFSIADGNLVFDKPYSNVAFVVNYISK